MQRLVVDAFHFVGLNGGSGGSGQYMLALVEGLSRLVEVRVLASRENAHHLRAAAERARRLTVVVEGDDHAEAIRTAVQDADLLYAPFTNLPERFTYAGVPAVTAVHDLQHRFLKSFFPEPERLERDDAYFDAVASADAVLTFSQVEQKNIADIYGVQGRIGVVPHAPFLAEDVLRSFGDKPIEPGRNPYVKKFGRYILYPAVNWPHKNHYRLLEAFRFLCEDFGVDDIKLVLSGASCVENRKHFYQELLKQPWAAQRVFEMGFLSNVQLFMLMKGAEALVFPSLYEGFGIPVLEAMRVETPVIASNLPSIREWFTDCYWPFSNVRDSWSMAGDLARFLSDSAGRRELRQRALARSMEFSSRRTAEETFQFLSDVAYEFQPSRQRRSQPYRDIAELKRKTYRLLIHVLVDVVDTERIRRTAAALNELTADAKLGTGLVWVCPHRATTDSEPAEIDPQTSRKGRRGIQHKKEVGGREWTRNLLSTLGDFGEVVYFDDADSIMERSRAVQFYAATQVEAHFHCFVRLSGLAELGSDMSQIFALHINAARSERRDIDGFYVGTPRWNDLRTRMLGVLHSAPAQIGESLSEPAVAIHNFVLSGEFVRGEASEGGVARDWFGKGLLARLFGRARIMEPSPWFAYVETELKHRVGHHFGLVQGLCDTAAAAGLSPIIGANRDATDLDLNGLAIEASFSSYHEATEAHVTPTNFAEELTLFLAKYRFGQYDYVYLHMPYSTLIAGVLQVIVTSRLEDLPVFLIRVCSVDESFRWHNIRETSLLQAIAELGGDRRSRIRVFVESVQLQRYFEDRTGWHLPVLLNPINRALVAGALTAADLREARRKNGIVVFGYFGEARWEKGFHLLPEIIEGVLSKLGGDRVQFRIQTSSNPINDTEEVRLAKRRLERLLQAPATGRAVVLYDQFPDMESYYNALASCDVILMPYNEEAYKARGSGIALESLGLGIPIVVPKETDIAATFASGGCVVVDHCDAESFVTACEIVLKHIEQLSSGVQEFLQNSPLVRSESQYMSALLNDLPQIADEPIERPAAVWIGNNVLSQGCSAVYDAQRDFLRRQGFEIYNVYVPFPDIGGALPSDDEMEKDFLGKSLGWHANRYDFGCYSWTLNQFEDDARLATLEHIAENGGSTEKFLALNSFNQIPSGLSRLAESRRIVVVCLNYIHLLPVVEQLGLLGRKGTRVVLETHDIQAYQHAIRGNRNVDDADKELELSLLSNVDAVVAISRKEYDEICEHNPWASVEYVLPPIRLSEAIILHWQPGSSGLNSAWLEVWYERGDLQETFDLRTPDSLNSYARWVLFHGREENPEVEIGTEFSSWANAPHPDFPTDDDDDGPVVSYLLGEIYKQRADLRANFPEAMDANHDDRRRFLEWITFFGVAECGVDADGRLSHSGSDRRGLPRVTPALLEALVLARPSQLGIRDFRMRILGLLGPIRSVDVLIVASDHPANVASVKQFIHGVFGRHLASDGVNLLIAGLAGTALEPDDMLPGVIAVGEVQALDPLYCVARVVAVPTTIGTGTPIKVLDAVARGLCVSISSFVGGALDLDAYGFPMAANADAFAADIRMLLASEEARAQRIELARRFSADHLQPGVYDAKWRRLAGLEPQESTEAVLPLSDEELAIQSVTANAAD